MIFAFPITIPASTPQTAPLRTTLTLVPGTITELQIQVPSGVIALANILLKHGLNQIAPVNADKSFATSNETIIWKEDLVLDQPPYELVAEAWNTDTANDHTLTVRVVITPLKPEPDLAAEIAALLKG